MSNDNTIDRTTHEVVPPLPPIVAATAPAVSVAAAPVAAAPVVADYVAAEVPVAAVAAPVAPVAAAPVAAAPVVVSSAPVPGAVVNTTYTRRFAPDAFIAGIAGLFVLVVGLLATTRAGFDGGLTANVVEVLGFRHTAALGAAEAVVGLFLLAAAASRSRGSEMFFGLVLAIAGFIGGVQTESFESLALESSWAWVLFVIGSIVALFALMMPRFVDRRSSAYAAY